MRRTLLILGAIGLFCMLLVVRLFYKQGTNQESEREWFAKSVRYEFSATVDSVRMFNEHTARLWCRVTSGNPQTHREDSLKPLFKDHDMLYLIFRHSGDSIIFIMPEGKGVAKGDSVRVSSAQNSIHFFRDGKTVVADELSDALTGFGRPFFLRKRD